MTVTNTSLTPALTGASLTAKWNGNEFHVPKKFAAEPELAVELLEYLTDHRQLAMNAGFESGRKSMQLRFAQATWRRTEPHPSIKVPEANMLLSQLVAELEDLLEQNGDMPVELDSGQPVQEVDFCYPVDPITSAIAVPAESIVIK